MDWGFLLRLIVSLLLMVASGICVMFAIFMFVGMRIAQVNAGEHADSSGFIAWIVIAVLMAIVTGAGSWFVVRGK